MSGLRSALRAHIVLRERRDCQFGAGLFGEPAWDMLLDLALARIEGRRVAITSACIASRVPPTTALRHISQLCRAGLAVRRPDPQDARRTWLEIADEGMARIEALFCTAQARAA